MRESWHVWLNTWMTPGCCLIPFPGYTLNFSSPGNGVHIWTLDTELEFRTSAQHLLKNQGGLLSNLLRDWMTKKSISLAATDLCVFEHSLCWILVCANLPRCSNTWHHFHDQHHGNMGRECAAYVCVCVCVLGGGGGGGGGGMGM